MEVEQYIDIVEEYCDSQYGGKRVIFRYSTSPKTENWDERDHAKICCYKHYPDTLVYSTHKAGEGDGSRTTKAQHEEYLGVLIDYIDGKKPDGKPNEKPPPMFDDKITKITSNNILVALHASEFVDKINSVNYAAEYEKSSPECLIKTHKILCSRSDMCSAINTSGYWLSGLLFDDKDGKIVPIFSNNPYIVVMHNNDELIEYTFEELDTTTYERYAHVAELFIGDEFLKELDDVIMDQQVNGGFVPENIKFKKF